MKNLFKRFAAAFAMVALVGVTACNEKEPDVPQEPVDGTIEMNVEIQSTYSTQPFAEIGEYCVILSNTLNITDQGMPNEVGGLVVQLTLLNMPDEDPMNAVLPSGTYSTTDLEEMFALSYQGSAAFLRYEEGDSGVSFSAIDGTAHVVNENGQYTITIDAELPMMRDEADQPIQLKAIYRGGLSFIDVSPEVVPGFTSDQNVTFEEAHGRYYGNWYIPHADDLNINFLMGQYEMNADGAIRLIDGYELTLNSIFMPKYENYNDEFIPLAEGTYVVDTDNRWTNGSETALPYLIKPGGFIESEYAGGIMMTGSALTQIDAKTGEKFTGLLDSGTMTVTRNGESYEIVFDFLADNGVRLQGSFSGDLNMVNKNDNDKHEVMQDQPWTTLDADHQINFLENSACLAYNLGNYLDPAFNQWVVTIVPAGEDPGELLMVQLVVDKAATEIPVGTYTVSWDMAANTMFPGWYTFGRQTLYSWFGDSTPDAEGYSSEIVAIAGGTIVLSKDASGNYTFDINLTDQADHKITGTWTGPMETQALVGANAVSSLLNAR